MERLGSKFPFPRKWEVICAVVSAELAYVTERTHEAGEVGRGRTRQGREVVPACSLAPEQWQVQMHFS